MLSMRKYFIIGIILLGFALRFVDLSNHPVGFTADEASFGYDAYSIMKTGKDQWGQFLPIVLKSFGDFKSPLYAYLAIPSVFIFDLTKLAVRLPNVIIGTLAIYSIYLLSGELGRLAKLDKKRISLLQLSASFLLALSPWHIMLSRGAFEANLITFFLPFGIYLFLKGLKNPKLFALSALFFGLSLFTYHSAKLITPTVILALIIVFRKEIVNLKFKNIFIALSIFLIFFFGLIYTFKLGGGSRISERSITQGALEEGAKAKIAIIQTGGNPFLAKFFHNKYQVVAQRFVTNYQQYFSFKFLFSNGAGDTTYGMIPYGVLYDFEGILLLGVVYSLFQKKLRVIAIFLLLWLLVAPLPAALATGVGYSGNRAEGMIPVLQIIEAFGVIGWSYLLMRFGSKTRVGIAIALCVLGVLEIGMFISYYFQNGVNIASRGMLYGSLEAGEWLFKNSDGKNIIVGRNLSEPQIFVAFTNKWDPVLYQKSSSNWKLVNGWVDQQDEYSLGKYTFKSINYKKDLLLKNTLVVGAPNDFPSNIKPYYVIYYPKLEPAYYIIRFE